jgi:hypothetical protein
LASHAAHFSGKLVSFEVLSVVLIKFLFHVDWYILYKTEIFNQNVHYCVHISPPQVFLGHLSPVLRLPTHFVVYINFIPSTIKSYIYEYMHKEVHVKFNPGLPWKVQHLTIRRLFTSNFDLNLRMKLVKCYT